MKKIRSIIAFTLLVVSNYSFCMEQENHKKPHSKKNSQIQAEIIKKNIDQDIIQCREQYDSLLSYITDKNNDSSQSFATHLKNNIKITDGIEYTIIHRRAQYAFLKSCIKTKNMNHFRLCLEYKFNPNRYHKQLSLLHYAIECCVPEAITILSEYNADLLILKKDKKNILDEAGETPLDYAVNLEVKECITAMANAMKIRYNKLVTYKNHCGLTKHILNKDLPCAECIQILSWQLKLHHLWDPCVKQKDFDNVIKNLQPPK